MGFERLAHPDDAGRIEGLAADVDLAHDAGLVDDERGAAGDARILVEQAVLARRRRASSRSGSGTATPSCSRKALFDQVLSTLTPRIVVLAVGERAVRRLVLLHLVGAAGREGGGEERDDDVLLALEVGELDPLAARTWAASPAVAGRCETREVEVGRRVADLHGRRRRGRRCAGGARAALRRLRRRERRQGDEDGRPRWRGQSKHA